MSKVKTVETLSVPVFVLTNSSTSELVVELRRWLERDESRLKRRKRRLVQLEDVLKFMDAGKLWDEVSAQPDRSLVIFDRVSVSEHKEILCRLRKAGAITLLYRCNLTGTRLSLSPFARGQVYSCRKNVFNLLEKCAIRQWVYRHYVIRAIHEDELEDYFRLRYTEWKREGYLSPPMICEDSELELNYTDRYAVPIGCYRIRKDRSLALAACLRILRKLDQPTDYVNAIQSIIDFKQSRVLSEAFTEPSFFRLPFDVLDSFPDFLDIYRQWISESRRVAEISRVITRRADRSRGLAENLVDAACVYAGSRLRMDKMILACKQEHARLYKRCGFREFPMRSDHFSGVARPVDAVPMERDLRPNFPTDYDLETDRLPLE